MRESEVLEMITILMASYNGEKYIGEQIESILSQSETDWKLVIQDDCSIDSTYSIASEYALKYPEKIEVRKKNENSGSASKNFFSMLPDVDGDYLMFSDDDDVWLPDKIEKSLIVMNKMERTEWQDKPLLVHTDLKVVNANLQAISDSMFQRQNFDNQRSDLNHLLAQNIITGCTMMINRPLINLANKVQVPEHAIMHDWWFALIAAAFGKIGFVEKPEVLYRQHGKNEIGAKDARSLSYNFKRLIEPDKTHQSLNMTYLQAEEFLKKFNSTLGEESSMIIRDYVSIPRLSKLQKIRMLNVRDFWKTGFARKLGQLLFM